MNKALLMWRQAEFYKMNVVANSAYADKAPLDPWTSGTKLTDEEDRYPLD